MKRELASMRPRQACLGIADLSVNGPTLTQRFNEAEASLPRNLGIAHDGLYEMDDASMRPRQACLGIDRLVAVDIDWADGLQ